MMSRLLKITFLSFVLYLQANTGFAEILPKNYSTDLQYKGRPIDTLCFYEIQSTEGFILLDKCGLESEPNREITFTDNKFINQGYVGYNYIWTINEVESHGASYYKILGKTKDNYYIIYTLNRSGGTGNFSSLYRIRREKNNRIHFHLIANGDRCNNGINSATIRNNQLTYFSNVTSADFFTLTSQHMSDSKVLADLSDCATCCVATAKHESILNEKHFDSKLIWIDLTASNKQTDTDSENNSQNCFNQLFNSYLDRKIRFLNKKDVEKFVIEYNKQCIKN